MKPVSFPSAINLCGHAHHKKVAKGDIITVQYKEPVDSMIEFQSTNKDPHGKYYTTTKPKQYNVVYEITYRIITHHNKNIHLEKIDGFPDLEHSIYFREKETVIYKIPGNREELTDLYNPEYLIYWLHNWDSIHSLDKHIFDGFSITYSNGDSNGKEILISPDAERNIAQQKNYREFINTIIDRILGHTITVNYTMIHSRDWNIITNEKFNKYCTMRSRYIHINISAECDKVLYVQRQVTNWHGIILDEKIRLSLDHGHTVRVDGYYYKIVASFINTRNRSIFLGVYNDPYHDDFRPDHLKGSFLLFQAHHVSEVPITWNGNDSLLPFDKSSGMGYAITGRFDTDDCESMDDLRMQVISLLT